MRSVSIVFFCCALSVSLDAASRIAGIVIDASGAPVPRSPPGRRRRSPATTARLISLMRGVNAFVAVENVFDADYDVGRTPIRTIGWPRSVRVGVRVFLP